MAGTFPITHAGLQVDIEREPVSAVEIFTAESGIETRSLLNSNIRWRYRVRIHGRSEVANELSTIQTLITSNYVNYTTFSFTDPYDSVSRICRFDTPPRFSQTQLPGWWMVEYSIISVV